MHKHIDLCVCVIVCIYNTVGFIFLPTVLTVSSKIISNLHKDQDNDLTYSKCNTHIFYETT